MRIFRYITLTLVSLVFTIGLNAGIPEGYYSKANGKKKAELKTALHEIIRFATVLNYGSGDGATWSGFYQTDRTEDNYCIDRYSPNKRQYTSRNSAISGMNIEHSFAKSWWGGSKNQAYMDLFNLMPSDAAANSAKSNYAMGKVVSASYNNGSIKIGSCKEISNKVWEPEDKWKGDFARNYMYMVTCYSDLTWRSNGLDQLDNNQWPTFNDWTKKLLLEWSRQDPVDEIETARNDAVYEIQGNRNPFIDFPNLCEYVWGDSVNYAFFVEGSTTPSVPPTEEEDPTVILSEPLTTGLGVFRDVAYDGSEGTIWHSDSKYGALANAYNSGKLADNYLLADVDLTGYKSATLQFEHQTGFNKNVDIENKYFYILITDDYSYSPEETAWEVLDADFPTPPSSGWSSTVNSGDIDLSVFAGRKITLAFRYLSNNSACYGWEIRNVQIMGVPASTGINDVMSGTTNTICSKSYDLTGRRIKSTLTKGIFIKKGKIFIR